MIMMILQKQQNKHKHKKLWRPARFEFTSIRYSRSILMILIDFIRAYSHIFEYFSADVAGKYLTEICSGPRGPGKDN